MEFKVNKIGGKFQKDTRKGLYEGIDTPGPGTYKTEVKETVNNMMRSTSKRNFDDFQLNDRMVDMPGPGQYTNVHRPSDIRCQVVLAKATETPKVKARPIDPGPGAY